ncbi:MAG: hypothetical protein ACFFCI_03415 [Promethearchaeota archaeon]
MNLFETLVRTLITIVIFSIILNILRKLGECPDSFPRSDNPRKELIEVVLLVIFIYISIEVFFLIPIFGFYVIIGFKSIVYLFIPLIYVHIQDKWASKDFGIGFKINSRWVAIVSIIFYIMYGIFNLNRPLT